MLGQPGSCKMEQRCLSTHVASHTRNFPDLQGTIETPSSRLPSLRSSPGGSGLAGTPADVKARWMMMLMAACLWCPPSLHRQLSPCVPITSTSSPQCQHWWEPHSGVPRRNPTAILRESSSRNPKAEMGRERSQALNSVALDANQHALSTSSIAPSTSWFAAARAFNVWCQDFLLQIVFCSLVQPWKYLWAINFHHLHTTQLQ